MSPPNYASNPTWRDITPIPQDDGGHSALATIAYTPEYSEAMSYLRAVMAANEYSERVLELTAHIIALNPAHYTVWLYRAKALETLNTDFRSEITYLNEIALRHIKNYQIWNHRQFVISALNDPAGEMQFLDEMFAKDAKNYHVWSYRQWLVKRFRLWNKEEMDDVERLLRVDIRNNSAWNHRWFLVFGREGELDVSGERMVVSSVEMEREEEFSKYAIELAPQNESPWSYLRGVYKRGGKDLRQLRGFAERFAGVEMERVRSSYALDLLADIYALDPDGKQMARRALGLLAERYDTIRVNYWNYRKSLLDVVVSPKAAVA